MENKAFSTEGLRSFTGRDGETTYYIVAPTADDIRGADWEYSKNFTRSLVAGITTTSEMTDILMRRGIIGTEFEKRSNELAEILSDKIQALSASTSMEERQELAIATSKAREELFQWSQRLNAPLANTCEQISDDARLEYLTSRIVVDKDGKKIWDIFENYLVEKEQGLAQRARFEVMLYLQGLSSDFLDRTPEAMAMKAVETEMLENIAKEMSMEADAIVEPEAEVVEAVAPEDQAIAEAPTETVAPKVTKRASKKDK